MPIPSPEKVMFNARSTEAIDVFGQMLHEWVIPFLAKWSQGASAVPSQDEINTLHNWIDQISNDTTIEEGYTWLPRLLKEATKSWRFHHHNFVNIHPSPLLPPILASTLVSALNPNNIVEEVSPVTWEMENQCIKWLSRDIIGFPEPEKAWGNIVGGGTLANMTALLVARDYVYRKINRPRSFEVGARGVIGQRPGVVITTKGAHYSLKKTLWFLGIGHENLIQVPVAWGEDVDANRDEESRFIDGIQDRYWKGILRSSLKRDEERGREEMQRFYRGEQCPFGLQPLESEVLKALYSCFSYNTPLIAAVYSVGTTHTGTIEDFGQEVTQRLREEDIHIHADAAFGGFALANAEVKELSKRIHEADSVTIDSHKLGFLHYPNGSVIFKDPRHLYQIQHDAPYLGQLAPTLEGSRPGTHVAALWALQHTLGAEGISEYIELIRTFVKKFVGCLIQSGEFQILHRVDLNTVAFAPLPKGGETRTELNKLVSLTRDAVIGDGLFSNDQESGRYIVNIDKDLAEVKVRDDNGRNRGESRSVDIQALRMVATYPGPDEVDAQNLVDYLFERLKKARKFKNCENA